MYYVSFLHLEVNHRHPVLLVFCDILLDTLPRQRTKKSSQCYGTVSENEVVIKSENFGSGLVQGAEDSAMHAAHDGHEQSGLVSMSKSQRIARNRWLKAYTMIRNPKVKSAKPEEEFEMVNVVGDIEV